MRSGAWWAVVGGWVHGGFCWHQCEICGGLTPEVANPDSASREGVLHPASHHEATRPVIAFADTHQCDVGRQSVPCEGKNGAPDVRVVPEIGRARPWRVVGSHGRVTGARHSTPRRWCTRPPAAGRQRSGPRAVPEVIRGPCQCRTGNSWCVAGLSSAAVAVCAQTVGRDIVPETRLLPNPDGDRVTQLARRFRYLSAPR
jgi:hypothetical protein